MKEWVVFFDCPSGHPEAVLRVGGSAEDVAYPDDLGCPVARVVPAEEAEIVSAWMKNGETRVQVAT